MTTTTTPPPSRFVGIRDLHAMLAPLGLSVDAFKRLGVAGSAPSVVLHVGPRMPRWNRAQVETWIASLDAQAQAQEEIA